MIGSIRQCHSGNPRYTELEAADATEPGLTAGVHFQASCRSNNERGGIPKFRGNSETETCTRLPSMIRSAVSVIGAHESLETDR
jgi:hypothetical protein